MKKRNLYISRIFVIYILLTSCTDVVDVDVPNGGERLVVEASINWIKGSTGNSQTIKLSTSSPYFESNTNTAVKGATVSVTDNNNGAKFIFNDQNNGMYVTTRFIPKLNHSYTLTIQHKSNTYTATETLLPTPNITNIEQNEGTIFGTKGIDLKFFFNDSPNVGNCYLGVFSQSKASTSTLKVLEDRFSNGNESFFIYRGNEDLKKGAIVHIHLHSISKQYYNFMKLLIKQSEGSGNPFQTTPAQLKGNCKNKNNPEEEVLGYFRLNEVSKMSYIVK